ncbi:MAG: 3-hydroxybutyryl-CoA dehydrogenase [Actinomycetota bacterium]|nr:3-hydroxybutyryl-CoA dehydrogenase [Actinomycetota bacterium]
MDESGDIRSVAVIGMGTMGTGIAEVIARHGLTVKAIDVDDDALDAARQRIEASTERAVSREKMTSSDRSELLDRIIFTTNIQECVATNMVIEAVTEDIDLKRELLGQLDGLVGEHVIWCTNTSSLSVTQISTAVSQPSRVVGLHFFNPAPVQDFVEIVRTVVTDDAVVEQVRAFAERIGKQAVICEDKAGFIANSLLFGYLNHAASMYEQKYASREDIDTAMRLGCGLPMGPLALLDLIGLDTAYEILDTMYRQGRDRLHAPSPILKHMVTAGLKGRKSGRGFYTYAAPGSPEVVTDGLTPDPASSGQQARSVSSVGVVGSGTMATGIIEVFAKAGFAVTFVARSSDKVDRVHSSIARSLEKALQRGKISEADAEATRGRVNGTTLLDDLGTVDLVVEAIAEDLEIKTALFENLDEICKDGAVLATTTSSLPVVDLAAVTSRPGDVVGLHFFNPAPVMKLVEVVDTVATSPDVIATAMDVVARIGKVGVRCGDRAGFIVNALLFPYLNDSIKMAEGNYASTEDIDTAMKLGCGYPMGPFELLDVVGLDVSLAIQQTLYREFREPGFAPAPWLEHLVTAGYTGRKAGRGFRSYA